MPVTSPNTCKLQDPKSQILNLSVSQFTSENGNVGPCLCHRGQRGKRGCVKSSNGLGSVLRGSHEGLARDRKDRTRVIQR